jgi:hypothetical protein
MSNHSVQPAGTPTQPVKPVNRPPPTSIVTEVLDAHRRRRFAQRLALLIARIRQATTEGAVDER